jgi:alanine dehydrogenase
MSSTLFLTSDDIDSLAEPAEFVDAVRDGYRQRGNGAPAVPRTKLLNEAPPGMLTGYTAVLPETGAMGGYMYTAGFGKADAWFVTPLFDAESGEPLAIIDGASMNPFKTGAAGAVGTDALARDEASTVGIIGSGAQARGQLRALAAVRELEQVWVFSPTREHRDAFATEFDTQLDATVSAVEDSTTAVGAADIVVTATTATSPVFDGEALDPGTHVTAIGQYDAAKRELDEVTIERGTYVPDLRERVMRDAGSFISAVESDRVMEEHIHAELGEIVAGTREGRASREEITIFDSGGTGIETVAGAYLLYERAREAGVGTEIEFAPVSEALTGR